MYFDTAEGPVFRPPSEAESFILRVTVGCSHNRCTYCNMYRSVQFRVRPLPEVWAQLEAALPYRERIRRVFLADGNALVLPTAHLLEILRVLYEKLPKLRRVSCYAGPRDILRKSPAELAALQEAGLKLVYYGMESGDDAVLSHVHKGVSAAESIEAGQRVVAAGMKLSLMVIIGLAGQPGSRQHAERTAQAINAIQPDMLSALTLMMYRGSELRDEYERGEFTLLSPVGIVEELRVLIAHIGWEGKRHCLFRSNHISNYVPLAGTLPADRERLLADCEAAAQSLADWRDWDPYNNVES